MSLVSGCLFFVSFAREEAVWNKGWCTSALLYLFWRAQHSAHRRGSLSLRPYCTPHQLCRAREIQARGGKPHSCHTVVTPIREPDRALFACMSIWIPFPCPPVVYRTLAAAAAAVTATTTKHIHKDPPLPLMMALTGVGTECSVSKRVLLGENPND